MPNTAPFEEELSRAIDIGGLKFKAAILADVTALANRHAEDRVREELESLKDSPQYRMSGFNATKALIDNHLAQRQTSSAQDHLTLGSSGEMVSASHEQVVASYNKGADKPQAPGLNQCSICRGRSKWCPKIITVPGRPIGPGDDVVISAGELLAYRDQQVMQERDRIEGLLRGLYNYPDEQGNYQSDPADNQLIDEMLAKISQTAEGGK